MVKSSSSSSPQSILRNFGIQQTSTSATVRDAPVRKFTAAMLVLFRTETFQSSRAVSVSQTRSPLRYPRSSWDLVRTP